jgi:hypothetical protein
VNPTKALNLALALTFVLALLAAAYGLYERGRQSERASQAEEALATLTQAYTRSQTLLRDLSARDSAAEAVRLALREPVEPTVTRFITLTDTLAYTDTVIVEAAREAVTTCSLALLACEARVSSADSVIAAQAEQIRTLEAINRQREALQQATCSGRVPTWVAAGGFILGAGAGAWIRGQD